MMDSPTCEVDAAVTRLYQQANDRPRGIGRLVPTSSSQPCSACRRPPSTTCTLAIHKATCSPPIAQLQRKDACLPQATTSLLFKPIADRRRCPRSLEEAQDWPSHRPSAAILGRPIDDSPHCECSARAEPEEHAARTKTNTPSSASQTEPPTACPTRHRARQQLPSACRPVPETLLPRVLDASQETCHARRPRPEVPERGTNAMTVKQLWLTAASIRHRIPPSTE